MTAIQDRYQDRLALGTRLAIIRHGEAYCNVESFIGGHVGCRGLTARGMRQIESLAERLRRSGELDKCAAVYSSILPRSIQSAEILLDALNVTSFVQTCALCERHPGVADGITWEEYEQQYKRASLPGDEPNLALSEGGESWVQFIDRAQESLLEVAVAHPGELTVVVAHGGIIDTSLISFLDLPEYGSRIRLHPEHASITEWEFVGRRWRLVRYNDAAHILAADAELQTVTPEWVHQDRF